MYQHTPVNLRGPFTRARAWWKLPPPKPKTVGAGAAADDIRVDLVERVRREIAEGIYDTPEKWREALARLFARLEPF